MSEISTVKQLCETIWALEKEFNLLDFEVKGVKVWQALRMNIYYALAKQLGILEKPHAKLDGFKNNIKSLRPALSSAVRYNPFWGHKKKDILIFDHQRKVLVDDKYIDIYTHYFIEELKGKGIAYEVYEKAYVYRHLSAPEQHRKRVDFIDFAAKVFSYLPLCRLKEVDLKQIKKIEHRVNVTFGTELSIAGQFQRYIKMFLALEAIYSRLFEIKRPDKIYVVVSYVLAPIISAAKSKGIEVVELQHGVFSDYHLGYSFPNTAPNALDYFPDKFFIWDDFWKSMCQLPLDYDKVDVYGFQYMEDKADEFRTVPKKHNQILIISQGAIGLHISDTILKSIDGLKDYHIIYKLHPGEFDRWENYPSLAKLNEYENISIIDNGNTPLYRLFAESEYVIGVFSTAIFESLPFDCKLFLLELPGIEYMKKIIDSGRAELIEKGMSIKEALTNK